MFLPAQELSTFVEHLAAGTIAGPQFLRLGKNYLELGRKEEAALILKRRLALVPEDPEAQALLKMALPTRISAPTGRNEPCPCGSGKRYKHCCGQDSGLVPAAPANAEALLLEATRHHQSRHLNEAEALYGQVLRLEPSNVFALQYSGVIAMQRGNATRGEDLVRQSLALRSDIPDFYNNLGLCLRMQDRLIEATAAYREALRLNPSYAEGENNLGLDLLALGLVSDSIEHCQRAIELRPDFAEAHWNLGLSLLTQGNLKQGWQEFEWRLKCQPFDRDGLSLDGVVLWQGQPLEGKTLLVRREQGLGDTLQMLRFIPDLVERGASVLLNVNPELQDLAASVSSAIKLVDRTTPLPKIDYYINLMSLPHRLDISLDSLPDSVPYMLPSSTFTADWQARLPKTDQLRVGLVWAGNPKHKNDRNRSCPLDELATLINTPGIAWFSLQKGPGRDQLMTSPHLNMVDLSPQLNSFSDTAAAMLSLDLVITVDTSVAHLAGALGRPVWVMLPFAADWRWLTKQEDSPWYPSARLFRQSRNGDWQGVCENISRALMEWPQTDHQ